MSTLLKVNSSKNHLWRLLPLLTLLLSPFLSQAQDSCFVMHDSKLAYVDPFTYETIYLVVKGDKHTEYHKDGAYYIQSTMKWINDCEYENTIVKSTLPGFLYEEGSVMHVKIERVHDGVIYCISNVGEVYWGSKLFILEDIPDNVKLLKK